MGESSLGSYTDVEPDFTIDGNIVSAVVDVSFFCPGANLCHSVCYKHPIITDVHLAKDMKRVTLFHVKIQRLNGRVWLLNTPTTRVVAHGTPNISDVSNVVELCSGIGAVSKGYQWCGGKTICFCDHNEHYCNWIKERLNTHVVCGDISSEDTIAEIATKCQGVSHTLSSGVSCQPFSTLGDQRHQADQRSISLPATLKAAVLLQSTQIIIECTRTAGDCDWVKGLLDQFCKATGYRQTQRVLHLHKSWPTKRTRWWCVLSHPSLPAPCIRDLPEIRFEPAVMHLISTMLKPPQGKEHEIELNQPEIHGFSQHKGGIQAHVMNACQCMPTATHSWGSQLCGCKCGCRRNGFSSQRLSTKGLYAVLVPTGKVDSNEDVIFRHLLPQEVSLFNGLSPKYVAPSNDTHLRLELSGVGQMASPLQSGWIMANLMFDIQENGLTTGFLHPRRVFANMCKSLLEERDQIWDTNLPNKYMKIFQGEIEAIDRPWVFVDYDVDDDIDGPLTQEIHEHCKAITAPDDTFNERVGSSANIQSSMPQNRGKGKGGTQNNEPVDAKHNNHEQKQDIHQYTVHGGVPGFEAKSFANNKRKFQDMQHDLNSANKNQGSKVDTPKHVESKPENRDQLSHHSSMEQKKEKPIQHSHETIIVWINETGENLTPVKVCKGATIGQIVQAESKLCGSEVGPRPTNGVGHQLSLLSEVQHEQIVCMEPNINKVYRCPRSYTHSDMPDIRACDRLQGLWSQKGWVANDEMLYYLQSLVQTEKHECIIDPIILQSNHDESIEQQFQEGLFALIQRVHDQYGDEDNSQGFTTILHEHHWIPLCVRRHEQEIHVSTGTNFAFVIQRWIDEGLDCAGIQIHGCHIPHVFEADCGFQALAWISSLSKDQEGLQPIQPDEAESLRYAFAKHIEKIGHAEDPCVNIVLGGAKDVKMQQQLQVLLEEHGVAKNRSESCCQHLIRTLGMSSIGSTLSAPNPWKDLKTKASQSSPPIQIVLTEELKAMIDKRIAQGVVFGKKQQKKQVKHAKQDLCVDASKIHVPAAIFQQNDGQHLQQISTRQIIQGCQGIAVVNINEALPFFQLVEPISCEGVGLLILDHADDRIPDRHDKVSFPATCPGTEEPVILTAALVQLGRKGVSRVVPKERSQIEESPTKVYRLVMYRDQCKLEWNSFCVKPVKHLLEHEACQAFTSDVIVDVWDRQFLTKQFTKCKRQEAAMFLVTIRLQQEGGFQFHDQSGVEGVFVEPRTDCGRKPAEGFQVIWLPKKSYEEVIVAKKVLTHAAWIVRHADRYGLRVNDADAKATHEQHRPDLGYLGGNELVNYRIGPLPFGTTKKSLIKLFQEWNWNARPGQPVGQSKDHSGLFWAVQASHPPSHWVFTMTHGDILISTIPNHKEASGNNDGLIVASKRTFAAITNRQKPSGSERPESDPMQNNDPWAKFVPSSAKAVTPSQMAQIETNVQRKVVEVLQSKSGEDVSMDSVVDGRVSQLEDQVRKLTDNFASMNSSISSFQQQQQHINGQIAGQMQGIKTQVDNQHATMQSLLENKMEEQMNRIEALLTKRAKTGE